MSTRRGVQKRNLPTAVGAAPASATESLPMDLLLEIAARCDVTTIIRCARATKFLRDAILDPSFRRRLELKAAAGGDGVDPALLFGVSYLSFGARMVPTHHIIHTPSSIQLHPCLQALTLDDSFEPVASRDRILLLRRYGISPEPPNIELRVFDTITCHVTRLPMVSTFNAHAFLSVSDGGGCYELVIMDKRLLFETFCSKHGQWGGGRRASTVTGHPHGIDTSSRVIGRTVYWLCHLNPGGDCWDGIFALDVDAAEANAVKLPQGWLSTMMPCKQDKHLLLASVRGRLSLLVAQTCGISMWTSTPACSSPQMTATCSRQLVIGAEDLVRPVGVVSSPLSFVLEAFGERSGAVIVRVDRWDLLRLDLGTKAVTRLHNPAGHTSVTSLFLHETDMVSLVKKSF